jgi:Ca2+-binding RTX toxin-like protein
LEGGPGNDEFRGSVHQYGMNYVGHRPVNVNLRTGIATGEGDDRLVEIAQVLGSEYDDVLVGDTLHGFGGNDVLDGRGFSDGWLVAGEGNDTIYGSFVGHDVLHGEDGNDVIYGNGVTIDPDTYDPISSGPGDDIVRGSRGQEVVSNWEGGADDIATYGGNDTIVVRDGDTDDVVRAGWGRDMCQADPGDTLFSCRPRRSRPAACQLSSTCRHQGASRGARRSELALLLAWAS